MLVINAIPNDTETVIAGMPTRQVKALALALFLAAAASCQNAHADDAKHDGLWRGNGGAAFSDSYGNTQSSSLTITADATRQTQEDKLSLNGQYVGSRAQTTSNGVTSTSTTANQWEARSRYDHNISEKNFDFGGLDFNRDQIQLLSLRTVVSGGLGRHVIKTDETQWDVLGGLSYRADRYSNPGVTINNQATMGFDTTEFLLGEESTNKLTESTTFKQHLMYRPNINRDKGYLVTFDSTLMVAINKSLSLRVSLQERFNSLAQAPIKKNDTLFFTGINVKFGE